jgi:hypothetical protein
VAQENHGDIMKNQNSKSAKYHVDGRELKRTSTIVHGFNHHFICI